MTNLKKMLNTNKGVGRWDYFPFVFQIQERAYDTCLTQSDLTLHNANGSVSLFFIVE